MCHVSSYAMPSRQADCLPGFTVAYVSVMIRWYLYWRVSTVFFVYCTEEEC